MSDELILNVQQAIRQKNSREYRLAHHCQKSNKNYLRLDCVYSCEQVLCWRLFPSGAYAVKSVLRRILREIPIQLEN